ncbi:MAG: hypothetical protein WEA61_10875 [Anaerolineales bacterium]
MAARKRRAPRWISEYRVEIFFLVLALLPAFYIAFGNPNTILDWYSSDDGFYYFQMARNLAAGQGFTFDGLNPTNGFHPLWLFLITPLFLFAQFDPLLSLRLLLVVCALLSAGTAILLYLLLRRYASAWVAAFVGLLWIVVPRIHDLTLHTGTEAGLNALCILLFWYFLVAFAPSKDGRDTLRRLAWLGLLGSLAILARLDNVFIVGFGGLWLWLRLWQTTKKKNAWPWRFNIALALFGPIAIVMLVYLAWNLLAFGTATPVSGQAKLWWGTLRNTVYGFPVNGVVDFAGQFVTDHPELGPWSLATAPLYAGAEWLLAAAGQSISVGTRRVVLLVIGGLLSVLGGALIWAQRIFLASSARGLGLLAFFLGCFAQVVYYKVSGSVAQQPWYWIAEMIFLLILLGLLLEALRRVVVGALPRSESAGAAVALIVVAVLSFIFLAFIQSAVRVPGDGSNSYYIHRARWLEANTEEGARVAITGAGNLAYFSRGRIIVNMDGLMNTVDYLEAMKAGAGAEYLADLGVNYIFGNEYILTETNPYAPMLAGHLEPYALYTFGEDRQLPLWRFVP